jgi:hypothetical protein
MSFYNSLFGVNNAAPILLKIIGKTDGDFGRFRDAYLNESGDKIIVYTRCGGGNRESYQYVFDEMEKHPNYIKNYDDDFDCTYAYFEFSIPDAFKDELKIMAEAIGQKQSPSEKFQQLLSDMEAGKSTKETNQAMKVGAKIFGEIEKGLQDGESKVIGI